MNLVLDIGNTHTKFAFFRNGNMECATSNEDELEVLIEKFPPTRCIISETGKNEKVLMLLKAKNIPMLRFHSALKLSIRNLYETPETLGNDRIAGVVAATALFPTQAVLKIDFGTCITFDVVNEKGEFLGGCIAPGLQMRLNAMHHFTQKLPQLLFDEHTLLSLTGRNTSQSMLSGALLGAVCEVDAFIERYKQQFTNLNVVVTGGHCNWVAARMENRIFARPYLVLEGLDQILTLNAS